MEQPSSSSTAFVPATGFDWLLPLYDPLVALFARERRFKNQLLDLARLHAGCRLLDVGCGSGTLLVEAQRRQSGCLLTGVDADPRMIARARRKLPEQSSAHLAVASACQLPIGDSSQDLVTCSLLFHHLLPNEKRVAVNEILRVLSPGGRLLLADFGHPASLSARFAYVAVRLIDGWERTGCNVRGQLPELIEAGGLTNVKERFALPTLLGTLRCYEATKSSR